MVLIVRVGDTTSSHPQSLHFNCASWFPSGPFYQDKCAK